MTHQVEPGETPERALVRELQEEIGVTVLESSLKPLTFASCPLAGFHLLMPLYGEHARKQFPPVYLTTTLIA